MSQTLPTAPRPYFYHLPRELPGVQQEGWISAPDRKYLGELRPLPMHLIAIRAQSVFKHTRWPARSTPRGLTTLLPLLLLLHDSDIAYSPEALFLLSASGAAWCEAGGTDFSIGLEVPGRPWRSRTATTAPNCHQGLDRI